MNFVFLMSSERSGSNLITRIFDAHSLYCGPAPSHLIRTFALNRSNYGDLSNDIAWQTLTGDVASFLSQQLGIWKTSFSADVIRQEVVQRTLGAIISYVYANEAKALGKQNVFIKENQIYRYLPFLMSTFADAKFVFLVRDPRDMALSWKLSQNHPGAVAQGTKVWLEDQQRCLEAYWYLRDSDRISLFRYEDLIAEPEPELTRICQLMGIDFEPTMLDFHSNHLTQINAQRINNWNNLTKPLISDNKKKYRDKFDPIETAYIEACCEREMEFFDYALDHPIADINQQEIFRRLKNFEKKHAENNDNSSKLTPDEAHIRAARLSLIQKIINRQFT